MNILMLCRQFWPEGGGAELATYLMVDLLAQEKNLHLTVVTGTSNPKKVKGVNFVVHPALETANKLSFWHRSLLPSVQEYLADLMKKFDTVYICQSYPLIPLAKKLGKRVVVHVHDYQPIAYNAIVLCPARRQRFDPLSQMFAEGRFEALESGEFSRALAGSLAAPAITAHRYWTSEADAIVCVSKRQADIISYFAPELSAKIEVVHNLPPPVPLARKRNFGGSAFLYVGGDSYIKGLHIFLGASARLLRTNPNVCFFLTRKFRRSSEALVLRLNEAPNASYRVLGQVDYQQILELHSMARALVFPSVWEETWGYAVEEAMLTGTIPIAARVGGVVELVESTLAEDYLFQPSDVKELTEKMERVLSLSDGSLAELGLQLREDTLRKFNTSKIMEDLLAVLG